MSNRKRLDVPAEGVRLWGQCLSNRVVVNGAIASRCLDETISRLNLMPCLEAEASEHFSWPQHPTTICRIRGAGWRTAPLIMVDGNRLTFPNPGRHFAVHFEVRILHRSEQIVLHLFYETNPYLAEKKLKLRVDTASLNRYFSRRDEFIEVFASLGEIPSFKFSPGTVQVGKATFDFHGRTREEVVAWLQPLVDGLTRNVNDGLREVDDRRLISPGAGYSTASRIRAVEDPATTASILTDIPA